LKIITKGKEKSIEHPLTIAPAVTIQITLLLICTLD
jgi:hypothetical protein